MPLFALNVLGRRLLTTTMTTAALAAGAGVLAVPAATAALVTAAPVTAAPATSAPASATPAAAAPPVDTTHELSSSMMPADSPDAQRLPTARLAPSAAALSGPGLEGVDVSSYQHGSPIDWGQVAASGQRFGFVKATESTGYVNPWFASDIAAGRAAGLAVGGYHFARPESSATAQADAFAAALGSGVASELPPVLDLESSGGLAPAALVAWTHAFLDRLQADTHRVPMIYTGPYFWTTATGDSHEFTRYPLWVANYTSGSPSVPGGWPTWTFWQYTSSSSVPGIAGAVDASYFQGTTGQLAALTRSTVLQAPVPPDTAGPVLRSGSRLDHPQTLSSGTGQYVAAMQSDGNFVVYGDGRALWSSGTGGNPRARLVLQDDGNLVLYAVGGQALWNSRTAGHSSPSLQLQNDGALVVSSGSTPLWSSGTTGTDLLSTGAGLTAGQYVHSLDGQAVALLQGDGNMVVYLNGRPGWATGSAGHPGDHLALQGDGNLVLYDGSGRPLWSSGSAGVGTASLAMQRDGNLVLYAGGVPRWASLTFF